MTKALTLTTGSSVTAIALLVAAAFALPGPAAAQPESLPVDLPDGPAAPGFDIDRFSNVGNGWFDTFYVERTEPLTDALEEGASGVTRVCSSSRRRPARSRSCRTRWHFTTSPKVVRVARTGWPRFEWCATAEPGLVPTIDGAIHHFGTWGSTMGCSCCRTSRVRPSGITLPAKRSTVRMSPVAGAAGEHAATKCRRGPVDGPVHAGGHLRSTVFVAGQSSVRRVRARLARTWWRAMHRTTRTPGCCPRSPRPWVRKTRGWNGWTMGLGVVTADTSRFYPMASIEEEGALVDEIDGRQILVFVDPTTFTPAALYVERPARRSRSGTFVSTPARSCGGASSWMPTARSSCSAAGTDLP